ncbi:MAG: hypothetical protein LBB72_01455 [Spirochaetaceae bacterium]|nr:hypothetical protein [Spirochaetaceae bacterium]
MKSDSVLLRDTLNELAHKGIQIGKIEFDQTEMKLLRQEAERLVKILQGKNHGRSIYDATKKFDPLWEGDGVGEYIQPEGSETAFYRHAGEGLKFLINAEGKDGDENARQLSERFNSLVMQMPDDDLPDYILDILKELGLAANFATTKDSPSGTRIGYGEQDKMNAILDRLDARLKEPVPVKVIIEYGPEGRTETTTR